MTDSSGEATDEFNLVVLPGDGIGPEVTEVAISVAGLAASQVGARLEIEEYPVGTTAIEAYGTALPEKALEAARRADAVFLGAVGSAELPPPGAPRPEEAVLGLRVELDCYANLRPAVCRPMLSAASSLREPVVEGVDILLVREATDGPFFAEPRGVTGDGTSREAVDTWHYDEPTVRRVVEKACDLAAARNGRVTSVDKANVLQTSILWREVAQSVAAERDDVELENMLVDNAAAQLVTAPQRFDVIVTDNLFGDILSDLFAGLVGSLGMLPSATIGGRVGLFEPVHGSAPDIAGRGIANPIAAIETAALMFRFGLGRPEIAARIDAALDAALAAGARTADIATDHEAALSTVEFGDRVVEALHEQVGEMTL